MLLFSLLEIFVHLIFKLSTQSIHLVLLLLHQLCLCCKDFLLSVLHMARLLLCLHSIRSLLDLVSLLIILLFCQIGLNLALVEQLGRWFDLNWQVLFEVRAILLQLCNVSILGLFDLLLIFLLNLSNHVIPVLIELLVLVDMGSLQLLLPLLMVES